MENEKVKKAEFSKQNQVALSSGQKKVQVENVVPPIRKKLSENKTTE
jgi:hypothetical protein